MTAAPAKSRVTLFSILLIVSGVLFVLNVLFSYATLMLSIAASGLYWLTLLAALALVAAFVVGALSFSLTTPALVAFWVAAVGWFLLALAGIVPIPGVISTLAEVVALVASLAAGILVYLRGTFARLGNIAFLVAMILAALECLALLVQLPFPLSPLIAALFGVALIAAGVLIPRRRR